MDRRSVLTAGLAGALAAPALATAQTAPIRLRMTTIVPEGTYLFTAFTKRFVDYVRLLTDGRVEIQAFPAGVLAPPFDVYRAVEDGRADMGHAPPALIYQRDPTMALVTSFPGGLGIEATMHWLYEEGGLKLLTDHHRDRLKLQPIVAGMATTEVFAHSWKPIRTAADMRGLKFRTLGVWADVMREFGAEPVATPTADVATALERRVIDAAKMAGPADNLQMGLNRIAPYIVVPGAHLPGGYFTAFMRGERWDQIPAPLQERILLAGRLTSFDSYLEKGRLDIDAMAEFRKGRAEIVTLDPAFVAQIKAAAREWARKAVAAASAQGNPWPERAMNATFAFQDKWEANAVYRL